ncbi:Vacuolar iron transporter cccA [Hyphodiscus hymeniophilus]|uniref:Vacuolar iron transporter cccA n=1 Tax=Hyphodiscus hymeniophilus TaxID=353542 RepID=A0A9P7AWR8_9HELO|nr:Vacuolar iron transporter cccA [Hyphodiscus hymeniophilus]
MSLSSNTAQAPHLVKVYDHNGTDVGFEMVTRSNTEPVSGLKRTHTPQMPLSSHPPTVNGKPWSYTQLSSHARLQAETSEKDTTIRPLEPLGNEIVKQQKSRKIRSDMARNFIIGFADGSTVPFALTAGLSSVTNRKTIIAAGLLELVVGAISMAVGAGLAAQHERQEFLTKEKRGSKRLETEPDEVAEDIAEIFRGFEIEKENLRPFLHALVKKPKSYLHFVMEFKYQIQKPSISRVFISAGTMALAYAIAGALPMIPYFITALKIRHALFISIGIAVVEFFLLGFRNGYAAGGTYKTGLVGALMTLVGGGVAIGASYTLRVNINKN